MDNASPPESKIITAALPVSSMMARKSKRVFAVGSICKRQSLEMFSALGVETEGVSHSHVFPLYLCFSPSVSHILQMHQKRKINVN